MLATQGRDIIGQVAQRLREVLDEVPFIEIVSIEQEVVVAPGRETDLAAVIQTPLGKRRLVVEVKAEGIPRTLRRVGEQLKAYADSLPDAYAVMSAPYISDRGRALCQQLGIGCLDLAGNVRLAFDQVFIERSGFTNPSPERRLRRALFSPRSTRVLRVLLADPWRRWYVRDLAAEAQLSLAQTSALKRKLLEQDLVREERRRIWLSKPEDLLREWAQAYTYETNSSVSFYTMLSTAGTEERLAAECARRGIRYGLALFSGAGRVAPFTRYDRAFAFVDSQFDDIAAALELKPVPTGANIVLLRPYDEGVFYGLQEVEGVKVVSDIQLYLDLKSYKGRGEEAADFLYERRIKLRWNQEPDQTTQQER